jgi:hypothetical protein
MGITLALLAESWVLWIMISSPQYPVTVPGGAYNSSKACIVDAWTQADQHAQSLSSLSNVKSATLSLRPGNKVQIEVVYRESGTRHITYACFPHPVKPE